MCPEIVTVCVCVCVCVCVRAPVLVFTALMCIVKPDGPPMLCKTDEIGEIVLSSRAGGTMYYGLPGVTKNTFEVRTHSSVGRSYGNQPVRISIEYSS